MTDRLPANSAVGAGPEAQVTALLAEGADVFLDRLETSVAAGRRALHQTEGQALHAIATGAAHGRGGFELAIGEGLDLILRRGGLARLAASGLGDLVRERLGMTETYGRRLRRNAEKLRERPLLRAAVLSGEVTSRKAEVLLDRTEPADDAYWTARAKVEPVRLLEAALRKGAGEPEEDWHRIELALPPDYKVIVKTALEYGRILEGPTVPRLHLVEVMLWEFLGEFEVESWADRHPAPADVEHAGPEATPVLPGRPAPPVAPFRASEAEPFDPVAVLGKLQALVRERAGLDERLRRACLLVRQTCAWRWTPFRDFTTWCAEGLGISPRTIREHIALERKLQALPPLRDAVRAHTLTLEQARQVARHATLENVAARIEAAVSKPAIKVRREADAEDDRRMWDASKVRLTLPERVASLFRAALRSGRHHFPGLSDGEILVCIAAHCVFTWRPEVERILKSTDKAILRDDWLCQVPGCSRRAEHLHHTWFRSRGGPDARWNLVGLCIPHHLFGVHMGYLEIAGRAPDELTFILGEEAVRTARATRNGAPARVAA